MTPIPVGTQYWGDSGFLWDFHRDEGRLRIDIEGTSLYDISFQHHKDCSENVAQCKASFYSDTNLQGRIDIR